MSWHDAEVPAGCQDADLEQAQAEADGGMAAANRRDYAAKRLFDDARRALDALVDPGALTRLSDGELQKLIDARDLLQKRSEHIVAVWD